MTGNEMADKKRKELAIVKKRFNQHRWLALSLGTFSISVVLWLFYMLAMPESECYVGMTTCPVSLNELDKGFHIFSWLILEAFIIISIKLALETNELVLGLADLEKEQVALVDMKYAYMRNSIITEVSDALNGSYHSKIYKAVVTDIENITDK